MPFEVSKGIRLLAESLQVLRDVCGKQIHILSGYRCEKHNAAVGGARKSFHVLGLAADLMVPEGLSRDWFAGMIDGLQISSQIRQGGLGCYEKYPNMIHIDIRGKLARWHHG